MRYIEWHITNACNLRCAHCMVDARMIPDKLSKLEIDQIANTIISLSPAIVNITGGEPMLSKYFLYLSRKMWKNGVILTLSTNGTLKVTDTELQSILKYYEGGIQVSIDSPDEEIHDKIRGMTGAHKKSLELVKRIREIAPAYNIQLCMCVRKDNYKTIEAMDQLLHTHEISNIKFLQLMQLGRAQEDLEMNSDEHLEAQNAIKILAKNNPDVRVIYADPISNMRKLIAAGNMNFDMLDIDSYGNVRITTYLKPILGNILYNDNAQSIDIKQKQAIRKLSESDIV